jgi:lipid A 3-O-deacylase
MMIRRICLLALAFGVPGFANAADIPATPAAPASAPVVSFYNPSAFEVRGGALVSTWGPEEGSVDLNGELVFPKIFTVPGWQDILIPRFHVGGMGNLGGRTSYGYAGALWTLNYDRYFTEVFFGGAVHDGPLLARDSDEPSLGCRVLYHTGANIGYRFDQNWSAMITFDHASNGSPTLSNCRGNTGISVLGLRVGYSF